MTTNKPEDDNVIDIHVNVNATDRLIEAIAADVDILPTDNDADAVVIRMLIKLRNTPEATELLSDETRARAEEIKKDD